MFFVVVVYLFFSLHTFVSLYALTRAASSTIILNIRENALNHFRRGRQS